MSTAGGAQALALTCFLAPSGRWRIGAACQCGTSLRDCWVGESWRGRQCCWRCEEDERTAHDIRDGGDAEVVATLTDDDRAFLRAHGWDDPIELRDSAV